MLDFLSNPAIEVGSGLATDPVDKVVGKVVAKELGAEYDGANGK